VEREYRVLHAIHKHNILPSTTPEYRIPVPEVYALCEDVNVIGTPFYVMEFLEGRIFADGSMPEVGPAERKQLYVSQGRLVETLC